MSSVSQGSSASFVLKAKRLVTLKTTGEAQINVGSRYYRATAATDQQYLTDRDIRVTINAISGTATYTTTISDVVPFTGDYTLSNSDNGKLLRCDDGSNVTVTAPATLPECFGVGFLMWGAGTITVGAGSGATKQSSATAISTQYEAGYLLVGKNADGLSAEFILSGSFA